MSWLSGWAKRIPLTIDSSKVDAALSDFPALVHVSASSGITNADVSAVFDELASDANRKKIAVTTDDGTTQCYVEIELWDHANEHAWLWVKVPGVSSSADTTLYLYYDSSQSDNTTYVGDTGDVAAQAVWDANFLGVWHLAQDPAGGAGCILDSTSNAHHGTSGGSMTAGDLVPVLIGDGLELDGSDDYVDFGTDAGWMELNGKNLTAQAIISKAAPPDQHRQIVGIYSTFTAVYPTPVQSWFLRLTDAGYPSIFARRDDGTEFVQPAVATNICDGADHFVWGRKTGTTFDVGFDGGTAGASDSWTQEGNTDNDQALRLGIQYGRFLAGFCDEIRISSIARPSAWLEADKHSCFDTLITFGPEETPAGAAGIQVLNLSVADVTGTTRLLTSLGTGGAQALITTLIAYGIQNIRTKLSDDLVQALRSSLGDQGVQNLLAGMGLQGFHDLRLQLGTFASGDQVLRGLISGEPAAAAQVLRLVIDEKNRVAGLQNLLLSLQDLAARFPDIHCAISIDGRPILHRILSATVEYAQDGIHNAITITSSDFDLYPMCNPEIRPGEQRIELQVGSRVLYFLIEERSGDDRQFTIWGRSLSARDDTPHAKEVEYIQDAPEKASEVAADLATHAAVDWEAPDWVLPEDFEFFGSPVEGIRRIAAAIGAMVRSQDDGSILVRRRWPVRPVDLPTASPDIRYSADEDIIEVGYRIVPGSGYNAVQVNGHSPEVFLPDLEVEEDTPIQGEDVHVLAYWAGQVPVTPPTVYVTAGLVTKLSDKTGEETERIIFSGGVGELSRPPEAVTSVTWIGSPGGTVSWQKHIKTVTIPTTQPRLADIAYSTGFSRYRLFNHNVEELVFCMIVSPARDVSVRVRMGAGDREALAINEPLLTDKSVAVERGRAFLDDSRYDMTEIDLIAPYRDEAVDGKVISLDQADLSISGNALIVAAGIEIRGPRIMNRIRARKWQVY